MGKSFDVDDKFVVKNGESLGMGIDDKFVVKSGESLGMGIDDKFVVKSGKSLGMGIMSVFYFCMKENGANCGVCGGNATTNEAFGPQAKHSGYFVLIFFQYCVRL